MKHKVKGFTLIELIVVMAIFSIILAAAWSFLPIAMKITTLSSARHDGDAAVTAISQYLKSELSPVEYLDIYASKEDTDAVAAAYARNFYEGVLRSGSEIEEDGSDLSKLKYADGQIHVLVIDNQIGSTDNATVTRYTYNIHCDPNDFKCARAKDAHGNDLKEFFINKAYYDNAKFQIEMGNPSGSGLQTFEEFKAANPTIVDEDELHRQYVSQFMTADNLRFVIKSVQDRGDQTNDYETASAINLVNIFSRATAVNPFYYVVNPQAVNVNVRCDEHSTITTKSYDMACTIVPLADMLDVSNPLVVGDKTSIIKKPDNSILTETVMKNGHMVTVDKQELLYNAKTYGGRGQSAYILDALRHMPSDPHAATDGYTFVYSYNFEIDTSKP